MFVGNAHLTGKLDLVDIDQATKTMVVTDYKTGSSARAWRKGQDYTKVKLHKYRQQLLFYKLLVEHSRDYAQYTVERGRLQFVEPDGSGDSVALDLTFEPEELATFSQLVQAVYAAITTLSLPDTSEFDATLAGIYTFEQFLIDKNK